MEPFEVLEVLGHGPRGHQVTRCRTADGRQVVVKRAHRLDEGGVAAARLRYEHQVLSHLRAQHARHVVRVLQLHEQGDDLALVLEDVGGASLSSHKKSRWPLAQALAIAEGVAAGLVDIHHAEVVHKDINPSNIVYNPTTGVVQLIDFGIASLLPREVQEADSPHKLAGTLAYMSPEQTGRINRAVDWRSDFYSLGVTLFEMLAGCLPFEHADVSTQVYALLAEAPPNLRDKAPEVPAVVADIVARLLHKSAEERYASAHGLHHDLAQCRERLQADGSVAAFVLAQEDRNERFALPERLYGRAAQVQVLQAAHARAMTGRHTVVLVHGPSGMGKSALLAELLPTLAQDDQLVGLGRYDPMLRHLPFSALSQALGSVCRRLLMEPPEVVESWQARVTTAVGSAGQALVELVPGLQNLLGPQKPLPALGALESESRLLVLLQTLVQCLCDAWPLTLILDDVQWADPGTLKLIRNLAQPGSPGSLLILLACRDHESEQPLEDFVETLRAAHVPCESIDVGPITAEDITMLVQDATQAPRARAVALAMRLMQRTGGNPFFVRTCLRTLWEKGVLLFDVQQRSWTWDIDAVGSALMPSDGADVLHEDLRQLGTPETITLGIAACLGAEFSLGELGRVCDPGTPTLLHLHRAMQAGLLQPLGGDYRYAGSGGDDEAVRYCFVHDRVLRAAYEQLTHARRVATHAKIGQLRWDLARGKPMGAWVFSVVDHLNLVASEGGSVQAPQALATLNLHAALLAMRSGSYRTALEYVETGVTLLGHKPPSQFAEVALSLAISGAECEMLMDHIDVAKERFDALLTPERSVHERVLVQLARITTLSRMGHYEDAIGAAATILPELGLPFSAQPYGTAQLVWETLKLRWALRGRDIRALGDGPFTDNLQVIDGLRICHALADAAWHSRPDVIGYLTLATTRWVLEQGISPLTPNTYVSMVAAAAIMNDFAQADAWADAVQRIIERTPDSPGRPASEFLLACFHHAFHEPPAQVCERLLRAHKQCSEVGDVHNAALCLLFVGPLRACASLPDCQRDLEYYAGFQLQFSHASDVAISEHLLRLVRHAQRDGDAQLLATHHHDELGQSLTDMPFISRVTVLHTGVVAHWLDGRYDAAADLVQRIFADPVLQLGPLLPPVCFYAALTLTQLAAQQPGRGVSQPQNYRMASHKLRALAKGAPRLFAGFAPLLDAEQWALQHDRRALAKYTEASALLAQSGYMCFAAAADECAGRFAAIVQVPAAVATHIGRALDAYSHWGAHRKVSQLRQEFVEVLLPAGRQAS